MQKTLISICILLLSMTNCNSQNNSKLAIESFIKTIETNSSIQVLLEKDLIDKVQANAKESYEMILKAIQDELKSCQKSDEQYQILSLKESINTKKVVGDELIIPDSGGDVYVFFCSNRVITYFLIKDNKIASFSTLNKGGKRVFLLL
jgi:hypothetical protein